MLWSLSLLLGIVVLVILAVWVRGPEARRRRSLFLLAMLLVGASNLVSTFDGFLSAEDRRATALERLRTPGIPLVVETSAEREVLNEPGLGLLVNAVLGGMLVGAAGTLLARSWRPE
jgi:peptidoglycan/LPS O-acetylase OafA/YrhL